MAIKTFTTGEVLTAADTNTYLANSGLVHITTVSYTSSSAVQVDNCFSSVYTRYRVVGQHIPTANLGNFNVRLRAANTDQVGANYQYTSARLYTNNAIDAVGSGATTTQLSNGGIQNDLFAFSFDIFNPNVLGRTIWTFDASNFEGASAAVRWWATGGYKADYVADGFVVYPGSGNWTGSLSVYGYRIS